MPQSLTLISQMAHLLDIPPESLHTLMGEHGPASHGDPTLVALSAEEAAHRIGIGHTTMYGYVASGEIPSVTIDRPRRVPAQAVRNSWSGV